MGPLVSVVLISGQRPRDFVMGEFASPVAHNDLVLLCT